MAFKETGNSVKKKILNQPIEIVLFVCLFVCLFRLFRLFVYLGCYFDAEMSERRRGRRMNCFPFIERDPGTTRTSSSSSSNSTGGFAFGDGTVYYANRLYILNYTY